MFYSKLFPRTGLTSGCIGFRSWRGAAAPRLSSSSSSASASVSRPIRDFTGAQLMASRPSTKVIVDRSIMNIISRNDDSTSILKEAAQSDPSCGLAHSLLGFELLRNGVPGLSVQRDLVPLLVKLDELCAADALSDREGRMGAALLAASEGRYLQAAHLLDSAVDAHEEDVVAMKLTQDFFLLAGDQENALRCVARRMHMYDDTHPLHGQVLGMLAAGYLERGLLREAEEIGEQAVTATRGKDTNAVVALLSAVQLACKGQQVSREVLDFAANNGSPGRHPFSFLEACFQIQQGNFNGAVDTFDTMMERISDEKYRYMTSMCYATLLLALVDLQVEHAAVDTRWERLAGFWDTMPVGDGSPFSTPAAELCSQITYRICSERRLTRGGARLPNAVNKGSKTNVFSYFVPQKQNLEYPSSDVSSKIGAWNLYSAGMVSHWAHLSDAATSHSAAGGETFPALRKKSESHVNWEPCVPELSLQNILSNTRVWATTTATIPLVNAFSRYAARDYGACAEALWSLRPVVSRIGAPAPMRDSIEQVMHEALLRGAKFGKARGILIERVAMRDLDGQAWFRLASVFGHLDEGRLAENAYLRAWQCGHRRVGSEGPSSYFRQ